MAKTIGERVFAASRAFDVERDKLRGHRRVKVLDDGAVVIDLWCDGDAAEGERVAAETSNFRRALDRYNRVVAEVQP